SRLEGLAEPNGIKISDTVFKSVKGKLDLGFADVGLNRSRTFRSQYKHSKCFLTQVMPAKFLPMQTRSQAGSEN
ncbi:hypothetical protein, partial [Ruegeria sp. SCP11]|uniref:hypothetical protein n=1 Tax=Ruegeria sp. SCP11 TaxID=3141378 RepID=UPI00334BEFF6